MADIEHMKKLKALATLRLRQRAEAQLQDEYQRCVRFLSQYPLDQFIVHDGAAANRLLKEGFNVKSLTTAWRVWIP